MATQRNDLFDQECVWTDDAFQSRAFLERILPDLALPAPGEMRVFEYGCAPVSPDALRAERSSAGFDVLPFDGPAPAMSSASLRQHSVTTK